MTARGILSSAEEGPLLPLVSSIAPAAEYLWKVSGSLLPFPSGAAVVRAACDFWELPALRSCGSRPGKLLAHPGALLLILLAILSSQRYLQCR